MYAYGRAPESITTGASLSLCCRLTAELAQSKSDALIVG